MAYEARDFSSLLGTPGFSDTLLNNHFTLYQGYVKNVNALTDEIKSMSGAGKAGTPVWNEIKRRFGWEWNGMRLHELYFGNMKNGGTTMGPENPVWKQMDADFGTSEESWRNDFTAVGMMRGIGWVVWAYDPEAKRTFNVWVNEHDAGHLAGTVPLLVMDVFEHAYLTDYGLKRADYIDAFLKAVDWSVVEKRLE